jgi:hypothetical protein
VSYRGGFALAAVLVLICLLAAGCHSESTSSGGSQQRARSRSAWCKTRPNAAWDNVLNGRLVELSRHVSIGPLALANDNRSFFAEIYGKKYSGVVKIDALTSRYTRIMRFADPVNYQAVGHFDGRWLVWAEYHSLEDELRDFTVWSWDSRTSRLRRIGATTRSRSGEFWPSSWIGPVAHQGYATWEQGGPNKRGDVQGEIHLVELATGRHRIVHRGAVDSPFLADGPILLWRESMRPGALAVMRAVDARTGRAVALRPAFRKVRGALWPASNGKSLMYATNEQTTLWWSPSLSVAPRRVFPGRKYSLLGIPFDEIWGRYTTFGVPQKTFLVDTIAGRYVRILRGGWAITGPKALVLLTPSKKKADHAITDIFYVPLKSLPPVPACP